MFQRLNNYFTDERRHNLQVFVEILLLIAVVVLYIQVNTLKSSIHDTKVSRDIYFSEQRGIECEILHKLDGFTPVCNLGPTPGSPVEPLPGTPTSTTAP